MFEPGSWGFVICCVLMLMGAASVLFSVGMLVWMLVDSFRRPAHEPVWREFTVPREVTDFPWTEGR